MNIWFALWVALSLTMLSFLVWQLVIAFKQKQAWKAFSEAHKIRYSANRFMHSPEMDGIIDGYKLNFFTAEHGAPDVRSTKKMTAIEISLSSVMPIEGGVASGGMVPFLRYLNLKSEYSPPIEGWKPEYIAVTSQIGALKAYLNDERLQILLKLMQIKNAWIIFIFRSDTMLLRVDTSNPLDSVDQIEKLTKFLIKSARLLELKPGEAQILKSEEALTSTSGATLAIKKGEMIASINLELEEDPVPSARNDDVL